MIYRATQYSKTCLKRPLKKKTKICFQDGLSLNADQKYCRMLQLESILQYFGPSLNYHFSYRPFLSTFEWSLKTGFTVLCHPLEDGNYK